MLSLWQACETSVNYKQHDYNASATNRDKNNNDSVANRHANDENLLVVPPECFLRVKLHEVVGNKH
jgi:hypothetical protein